jgi:hypothetical protein
MKKKKERERERYAPLCSEKDTTLHYAPLCSEKDTKLVRHILE